jgi:CheY-like chemotaxis protein
MKQTATSVHHNERITHQAIARGPPRSTASCETHRAFCTTARRAIAQAAENMRASRWLAGCTCGKAMHYQLHRHDEWEDEPTNPFEQLLAARILLAEDDPALRSMMAARLRQDGCDVAEARSGDEALELISTIASGEAALADLDLVIIDVRMPGLSGLEVVRLLRSWKWSTPVLFVTAYPDPELAAEIGELDARLLAKPFGLSRLSNAALEAIRGRLS